MHIMRGWDMRRCAGSAQPGESTSSTPILQLASQAQAHSPCGSGLARKTIFSVVAGRSVPNKLGFFFCLKLWWCNCRYVVVWLEIGYFAREFQVNG